MSGTRTVRRDLISATLLLMVTTRGREMTRAFPSRSKALSRTESACEPLNEPSTRSRADPDPALVDAGKSAMKGTPPEPVPKPEPPNPTRPGKFRPVGFPVPGPALYPYPH